MVCGANNPNYKANEIVGGNQRGLGGGNRSAENVQTVMVSIAWPVNVGTSLGCLGV